MNSLFETIKRYIHFIIISSSEAAFYFILNTFVGLISSFFHSKHGVSYMMMNLMISGVYQIISVVIQPILGHLSDRFPIQRFKRRAFILIGTVISAIGMTFVGFSYLIIPRENITVTNESGVPTTVPEEVNTEGAVFGFVFAFVAYMAFGFVQSPSRAIIVEVTPAKYHFSANFMASMTCGFVQIVLYVVAGACASGEYYYPTIFTCAGVVMCVGAVITTFTAHEGKSTEEPKDIEMENENKDEEKEENKKENDEKKDGDISSDEKEMTEKDSLKKNDEMHEDDEEENIEIRRTTCGSKIKRMCKVINKKTWLLYLLVLVGMMAFGGLGMNITSFYATNIYNANPQSPLYAKGVSMGLYVMAVLCASQTICSLILPFLQKYQNFIFILAFLLSTLGFAFFVLIDYLANDTGDPQTYVIVLSFIPGIGIGLLGCCLYSIPFALIRKLTDPKHLGITMALLTSTIQLAMCIVGWCFSLLLSIVNSLVVVMWFSCILSFIAFIISIPILFYINPFKK